MTLSIIATIPVPAAALKQWGGGGGWEEGGKKCEPHVPLTWRALSDERKAARSDAKWTALIAEVPAWCAARYRDAGPAGDRWFLGSCDDASPDRPALRARPGRSRAQPCTGRFLITATPGGSRVLLSRG